MNENVAVYHRVSTQEQSLDRQRNSTSDYVTTHFDVELDDLEFFEDKSTGTNVDRSEFREMMDRIENGEIDVVIVKELSRLSRSLQDLQQTVARIVDQGSELHFQEENMQFSGDDDPFSEFQLQILGAVAEFQAKLRQEAASEGLQARIESDDNYRHGPAPLGFNKEDGILYEKESYPHISEVLSRVSNDDMSKREASRELDTSRATVRRAIEDRSELYNIES
ncbi:recombinase family protein [Halomicroarcula sp. F28]|uniref:recombinase family protein n=1 Tax=Haloarcula salinisoli TaxID=2487746 RepID=UPI001C734F33|nr:recombinase family protein [Halomicroarcula salinisoli]MBX0284736.1 recombinase family protein [Halomicroarcula salinisoli]